MGYATDSDRPDSDKLDAFRALASSSRGRISSFMAGGPAMPSSSANASELLSKILGPAARAPAPAPRDDLAERLRSRSRPASEPEPPRTPSRALRLGSIGKDRSIASEQIPEVISLLAARSFSLNGNPILSLPAEGERTYYAFIDKVNHFLMHDRKSAANAALGRQTPGDFAALLSPMGIGPDEPRFGYQYDQTLRQVAPEVAEAFDASPAASQIARPPGSADERPRAKPAFKGASTFTF